MRFKQRRLRQREGATSRRRLEVALGDAWGERREERRLRNHSNRRSRGGTMKPRGSGGFTDRPLFEPSEIAALLWLRRYFLLAESNSAANT